MRSNAAYGMCCVMNSDRSGNASPVAPALAASRRAAQRLTKACCLSCDAREVRVPDPDLESTAATERFTDIGKPQSIQCIDPYPSIVEGRTLHTPSELGAVDD